MDGLTQENACCAEIGPLLIAPGTSGRAWRCQTCGRLWSPEPKPTTDDPGTGADT